jgi:hypothetical protein
VPTADDRAPGVGAVVALTYRATVDQPQSFVHSRAVGAHVGLTLKRYHSGETDHAGGVSNAGSSQWEMVVAEGGACGWLSGAEYLEPTSRSPGAWPWVLHRTRGDGSEFRWSKDSAAVPAAT